MASRLLSRPRLNSWKPIAYLQMNWEQQKMHQLFCIDPQLGQILLSQEHGFSVFNNRNTYCYKEAFIDDAFSRGRKPFFNWFCFLNHALIHLYIYTKNILLYICLSLWHLKIAVLLEDFDMLNIHWSFPMIPTPNSKFFLIFCFLLFEISYFPPWVRVSAWAFFDHNFWDHPGPRLIFCRLIKMLITHNI